MTKTPDPSGSGSFVRAAQESVEAGTVGPEALPAVLRAMDDPWDDHSQLSAVVERICLGSPVDVLLDVVDQDSFAAFQAALRASATRRETDLWQGLLDRLRGEDELPTRRACIAKLVGDRGDASAVPVLWEVFVDASREDRAADDSPVLAVAAAEALAKLGNFDAGAYLVTLLADDYPPTAALAATALWTAMGPDMTRALAAATRDADNEVGIAGVRALFLLRDVAAVDALVEVAASSDPEVANNAVVGVNDITGAEFSTSWPADQLARQWRDYRHNFDTGVHYRLGRPLRVRDLFGLLRTDPHRHDEVIEEIRLTTGVEPVDGTYPAEMAAEISARLPGEGVLYRWGHPSVHLVE